MKSLLKSKKVIVFLLTLLLPIAEAQAQNPYIKPGSIGSVDNPAATRKLGLFHNLSVAQWMGQRFLFLPTYKSTQHYGYQEFSKDPQDPYQSLPYNDYVGRIARVTDVDEANLSITLKVEGTEEIIYAKVSNDTISGICLVSDIDSAKKLYLGKTLWCNAHELTTYDATRDGFDNKKRFGEHHVRKFGPVKVVDVVAGWANDTPVRFILRDASGHEGFVDVHMSNTNVPTVLQQFSQFDKTFLTSDPHRTYHWSAGIWNAIENDQALIGMSEKQAEMSWGSPETVNTTTTVSGEHEQWVYSENKYLYFDNGKLTSKQE